jgi:hypothetical protein
LACGALLKVRNWVSHPRLLRENPDQTAEIGR